MRLPRVQFTMRGILIAVACIGLVMGGLRLIWLRSVYRKVALAHAAYEKLARTLQTLVENEDQDERKLEIAFGIKVQSESEAVKAKRAADAGVNQKTAEYHAAMKHKYEQAASSPWIPITPDPPRPEPDVVRYP
jgi:hypothetical protein